MKLCSVDPDKAANYELLRLFAESTIFHFWLFIKVSMTCGFQGSELQMRRIFNDTVELQWLKHLLDHEN